MSTTIPRNRNFSSKIYFTSFVIVLASFNYGYNLSVVNAPIDTFLHCQDTSSDLLLACVPSSASQWDLVVSMFSIGGIISAISSGLLIGWFGRRKTLMLADAFFLSGFLCMGLANIVEIVIVGRFLIGIGSGLSTVVAPGYLGEIAPARIRGAIGSLHPISLVFGIFMAQVLGIPWFDANNWRLLFGFGVITTTIQLVGLIFCYDCPSFYIKQNNTNYALKSYKSFNSPFNEEEFKKLSEESKSFTHVSIPQLLRTKIAYRSLVINVLLQMFLQFSGINGVFFFSTIIFQQAGNSDIATYVSMGLGLTNFLFTLSTVYFVEKFGRRSLLLVGTIGQALCSILIVIFLNFSINVPFVIAIYFFIAFFAIGLGCIPWIITSDIFPPNAVPAAGSISVTMNWVSNFIVAITFQSMVGGLGRLFFLPYMGVLIVASVFVYFMCRETKGKTPGYIVNIVNQENENA